MGLVLGYLSLEYSLLAAIALHIYNNFILAEVMGFLIDSGTDSLGRLSLFLFSSLPAIYAIYYVISKKDKIKAYIREHSPAKEAYKWAFISPAFLAAVILSILEIIRTVARL